MCAFSIWEWDLSATCHLHFSFYACCFLRNKVTGQVPLHFIIDSDAVSVRFPHYSKRFYLG